MYNGLSELWFNLGLNVAKYNLGKVNLKQNVGQQFSQLCWGGAMPLAEAPHDFHTQLLACSSSQSVFAQALLPTCQFCAVFFPILPPPFILGLGKY